MVVAIHVAPARAGASEASHSSVCSSPSSSVATSLLLLAFCGAGDDAAASLRLERRDDFAYRAAALRLPSGSDGDAAGSALLRHAVRNVPELRGGGALLARAEPSQAERLARLGFEAAGGGGELAYVDRRDLAGGEGSLVAMRTADIDRALGFWSLLGFKPARCFTTSGARAAWLAAPWSELQLELIEVPHVMLSCGCNEPPKPRAPEQNDALLGLAHVNLDVTALCAGSVGELVDAVQARSDAKFGMSIRVLEPPHQRMMGDLVAEAVVLRAPDGVQLGLVRRAARLDHAMEPDWTPKVE